MANELISNADKSQGGTDTFYISLCAFLVFMILNIAPHPTPFAQTHLVEKFKDQVDTSIACQCFYILRFMKHCFRDYCDVQ